MVRRLLCLTRMFDWKMSMKSDLIKPELSYVTRRYHASVDKRVFLVLHVRKEGFPRPFCPFLICKKSE
jgi:hypothetical protein